MYGATFPIVKDGDFIHFRGVEAININLSLKLSRFFATHLTISRGVTVTFRKVEKQLLVQLDIMT